MIDLEESGVFSNSNDWTEKLPKKHLAGKNHYLKDRFQSDLSDGLAALQFSVRLGHRAEGKAFGIQKRAQTMVVHQTRHVLKNFSVASASLPREQRQKDEHHMKREIAVVQKSQIGAATRGDRNDDSAEAGRLKTMDEIFAANRVKYHIEAIAACVFIHILQHVLFPIIDRHVGADLAGQFRLGVV